MGQIRPLLRRSLINILLCMLAFIPALLPLYIIARNPERDSDYEVLPDSETVAMSTGREITTINQARPFET